MHLREIYQSKNLFIRFRILLILVLALSFSLAAAVSCRTQASSTSSVDERVEKLLSQMTLEEKVYQLRGYKADNARVPENTYENKRLGIPGFNYEDCGHGVGSHISGIQGTCFPVELAMASTWDEGLVNKVAAAIGREMRAYGLNQGLAPCIDFIRDPRYGRSQEGFKRVSLDPGRKTTITFALTKDDLSFYDVKKGEFTVEPGKFEVMAGNSSASLSFKGSFEIK